MISGNMTDVMPHHWRNELSEIEKLTLCELAIDASGVSKSPAWLKHQTDLFLGGKADSTIDSEAVAAHMARIVLRGMQSKEPSDN
ncbi:hypothetical protein [Mariniblastus fucicola]|uniref:Uncharacterized protein n=1 Tax=Mariniblastus fucicola TaxID=980251 RepID=A0A5B9PGK3_9BACT|nr:hypothetical protein [Mariniblastus fucicola]QEG23892.1 hypothetical protein MFFC18_37960 [Mariniblastus fucicola]